MKEKFGSTIVHYASMNGHDDTVRTLLEGGASSVVSACAYSNNNVVTMLLHFGADPNQKENGGWTPFPTSNGWSPLMAASENGHINIIDVLVKAHCDPNLCAKDGMTALYLACQNRHSDIVSSLLEFGADPNSRWMNSWTPLMAASIDGYSEIVELLLQANGDPNICSKEGLTSLYLANQNGHSAIVTLLLESGADPHLHTKHQEMEQLKYTSYDNINACLEDGSTAIYIACQNGCSGVVSILLQFGADPTLQRRNTFSSSFN